MIRTAVLLAAGEGSRLRDSAPVKPLAHVNGEPLIAHALHGLAQAGIARVAVVLGYEAEAVAAYLGTRAWPVALEHALVGDWRLPNGVSALAGLARVGAPALLAMCDHLVDPALYARLAQTGAGAGLTLGIDRRLDDPAVDLDDVTRVSTRGDRIMRIGKGLTEYDAFDTGVFAVGAPFVAALRSLSSPSVSQAVSLLAVEGRAGVAECSDLRWIDVDDTPALRNAERVFAARPPIRPQVLASNA